MELEVFYKENYPKMLKYVVRKISNRVEAEDILQEVFVSCLRNFSKFDATKSTLSTWLYVCVNNRIKNFYRDKKNIISVELIDLEKLLKTDSDLDQSIKLLQIRSSLATSIRMLPILQQRVIVQRYFRDQTTLEISNALDVSQEYVRVLQERALRKLANDASLKMYLKEC